MSMSWEELPKDFTKAFDAVLSDNEELCFEVMCAKSLRPDLKRRLLELITAKMISCASAGC